MGLYASTQGYSIDQAKFSSKRPLVYLLTSRVAVSRETLLVVY